MKILFVARTYPPLVGGMERFASDFYQHMQDIANVKLIANPIGKKKIIHFFFRVMFYLVFHAREFDIIHFNDAILSPLIPIIRLFSDAKVTFTVHGLDIVYKKFGYQYFVIPFLKYADKIFPVSHYTKDQCLRRNIADKKMKIIPNGLNFSQTKPCTAAGKLSILKKAPRESKNKVILLSLGRLIARKGHAWFIENVFIKLPQTYSYFIAGDGPERQSLSRTISRLKLQDRIVMFGYVSDEEKACLFEIADLFIMPNITDKNDQEGFGIVLLEAGSYGLPSIASNIEGIKDAVVDGVTGILIEEKDEQGFISAIMQAKINRENIVPTLRDRYDWKIITQIYYREFQSVLFEN